MPRAVLPLQKRGAIGRNPQQRWQRQRPVHYRAGMLVQDALRSIRLSSPVKTRPGPIS
jgi:hypothetical protein